MDLKMVIMIALIFGGAEALLCKFSNGRIAKWFLPISLGVISLIMILVGKLAPLEGMQDLAYLVTGILAGIAALSAFVVAGINQILHRGNK